MDAAATLKRLEEFEALGNAISAWNLYGRASEIEASISRSPLPLGGEACETLREWAEDLAVIAFSLGVPVKPFSDVAATIHDYTKTDVRRAIAHLRAELRGKIELAGRNENGEGRRQESREVPALGSNSVAVLICLARRPLEMLNVDDIEVGAKLSRSTVSNTLKELISIGLVHRPNGTRGGATVTDKGKEVASQIGLNSVAN